jgi:hypothetical protein
MGGEETAADELRNERMRRIMRCECVETLAISTFNVDYCDARRLIMSDTEVVVFFFLCVSNNLGLFFFHFGFF